MLAGGIPEGRTSRRGQAARQLISHVTGQLRQMGLLLGQLLLELHELLLLALPDGPVLGGPLALLEGITAYPRRHVSIQHTSTSLRCDGRSAVGMGKAYDWPVLGGEPVSPSDMRRAVVVKAREPSRAGRAALATASRSIVAFGGVRVLC